MTTPISNVSAASNQTALLGASESLNTDAGRLSGINSSVINSSEIGSKLAKSADDMRQSTGNSRLSSSLDVFAEQTSARLEDLQKKSQEAKRARTRGDEAEVDESPDNQFDELADDYYDTSLRNNLTAHATAEDPTKSPYEYAEHLKQVLRDKLKKANLREED